MGISWFEFRSRECSFHAMDCSMRLLEEIAVLLGVYKLCILDVGDCYTDLSTILVFVCKNRVVLAEFQHIDGSARWLTSSILRMQVLYLVLVIADPRHSCCSACPVFQKKKYFSFTKKLHRSCCHQKLTNKIKPPILWVDDRLLEQCWEWISWHTKNPTNRCNEKSRDFKTFVLFSTRRKWQTWLPHWCYSCYT